MYSTFSLYSFTVRRARSKKRPCHSSPDAWRRRLTRIIELILMDFITTAMVSGWAGAQMGCPSADGIRQKYPGGQKEGMKNARPSAGGCQTAEIRAIQFVAPFEEPHSNEEEPIG
jgi:hypothetical protein